MKSGSRPEMREGRRRRQLENVLTHLPHVAFAVLLWVLGQGGPLQK